MKGSYRSGIDPPSSGTWFDFGSPVNYEWYDESDYADAFVIGYHDNPDEAAVPGGHVRIEGEGDSYDGSVLILPQRFNDPDAEGNHDACIEVTYTVTYGFPDGKPESRQMVRTMRLADIHKYQLPPHHRHGQDNMESQRGRPRFGDPRHNHKLTP